MIGYTIGIVTGVIFLIWGLSYSIVEAEDCPWYYRPLAALASLVILPKQKIRLLVH